MLFPHPLQRWNCRCPVPADGCQSRDQNRREPRQDDEYGKAAYIPRDKWEPRAFGAHAAFASPSTTGHVQADGVLPTEVMHWRGGGVPVAATRTSVPATQRPKAS